MKKEKTIMVLDWKDSNGNWVLRSRMKPRQPKKVRVIKSWWPPTWW